MVCEVGLESIRAVRDPEATTLRDVLRGAGETVEVALQEPSVLQNLNTEEALSAARRQWGRGSGADPRKVNEEA